MSLSYFTSLFLMCISATPMLCLVPLGKWTGSYIGVFYSTNLIQSYPYSPIHTSTVFYGVVFFFFYLTCRLEQLGVEPQTFQLVYDLLYLLSYNHFIAKIPHKTFWVCSKPQLSTRQNLALNFNWQELC